MMPFATKDEINRLWTQRKAAILKRQQESEIK